VNDGIYSLDDTVFILGGEKLNNSERRSLINNIIKLLIDNEKYQIALLDDYQLELCRNSMLIKRGHKAFIEPMLLKGNTKVEAGIEVDDSILVEGLYRHF